MNICITHILVQGQKKKNPEGFSYDEECTITP